MLGKKIKKTKKLNIILLCITHGKPNTTYTISIFFSVHVRACLYPCIISPHIHAKTERKKCIIINKD